MPEPNGLYGDAANTAWKETRASLDTVVPAKPYYGPDYRAILKTMESDPRIAQKVAEFRRFQHLTDGADMATAERKAAEDLVRFKQTFGR